ncbi:hypothetical protein [Candidatus Phytoplasma solani]|uniref:Immunodominant membrane protein n=1 Tax=Candidatus Phytoplasma solani TaxID=69896 RepID=A0A421NYW8_9MOLU|nr:hypothetical protein [Candidatus Phytoplasma solani]RMI89183.1 hypothetical protein PSSA1_v1c0630 [Candidatus Phytoplasma solani]RMI89201.1 hypothetical protein PSSA1_v1c0810 [Candidatus Phytoplasma solani]CCP87995.1 putative immunodominant membrane protein, similar to Imp [Candidatus Phytoplasma solani]CCP88511.1 Immunodominant membrane protein [Candidatus Phytoplasma solani]
MKFIATKKTKIIVGAAFIITTLYLGLGFWISFNPINWLSPQQTWAKESGESLLILVKEFDEEKDQNKKKHKKKEIKNQLNKIKILVIQRYQNESRYKKNFNSVNDAYKTSFLNNNSKTDNITVKNAQELKEAIDNLFNE